jgi:acylphosphatase
MFRYKGVCMASSMERARARVYVSGKVQGVNFRAQARDEGRRAGVDGYVRNLGDGRVEAVFEGSRGAVQRLVSWCYSGPVPARVVQVEVHWEPPVGEKPGFQIIW